MAANQSSYNLSRRIHDVQTYPYKSPQGATILIYSHDSGITIQWRGGRRLKPQPPKTSAPQKQNGTQEDSVMLIDSDDDEPPAKSQSAIKFEDKPVFEDEVEDEPHPEVVQTLDLTFGTAVMKVAVMPLPAEVGEDTTKKKAPILEDKMVFAVSCVTNDVYLVTTPLTPPSNEAKQRPELKKDLLAGKAGSGAWGESLVLLKGQIKMSDGISISLVLPGENERSPKTARAVVASHSREASGVLNLWDIPLDAKSKPEPTIEPFQSEFLPKPLASISFNPTHSTQLLTVSSAHGVRIYDFALPSLPPDPEATGPFPAQGSWLLTLYQPFVRPSSMRKPIVDATWVSHGHAVFALLADGMWGIWDIDGAGPGKTGPSMSSKLKMGVRGAALTAFSVSGFVEGTSSLRSVVAPNRDSQSGEFAPMTPHTRKAASVAMSAATTADRLATIHGGIKVTSLPSTGKAIPDESLALWVGSYDHVCVIPLVSKFWEAQLRKPSGGGVGLFSGGQPARMIKLQELSTGLLGERCCGVGLLVGSSRENGALPVEVLIRGESRLVIAREGASGQGKAPGTLVSTRRRLFSDRQKSDALIVHGGSKSRTASTNFNLSTVKTGSLRFKQQQRPLQIENGGDGATPKPRSGFAFMDDLDAAADVTGNDDSRDVDAEMLDIMGIDQALASMEGTNRGGRKRVVFDED